jgi:hypothetical protein
VAAIPHQLGQTSKLFGLQHSKNEGAEVACKEQIVGEQVVEHS